MKQRFPFGVFRLTGVFILPAVLLIPVFSGCKSTPPGDGAPPPAHVIQVSDMNLITIDSNDVAKFQIVQAEKIELASELQATGAVVPDVSREVPVISMASGRVVDIKTRLDDNVTKGQLLLKVQSPDITNAFNTYLKAANDEQLANKAYAAERGSVHAWSDFAGDAGAGRGYGERCEGRCDGGRRAVENPGRRQGPPQQHRECLCADQRRHCCAECN